MGDTCLSFFNYGGTNFNFRSQFNLTFSPHPDMDVKWQKALERVPVRGWEVEEVGGLRSSGWSWDSRLREEMNRPTHGGRVRKKMDTILPFFLGP